MLEEIETRLEEGYCLDKRVSIIRDMKWLISRVKELEGQQQGIGQMINRCHARIEQLEEGIKKHREMRNKWHLSLWIEDDEILYELLEK